MTTARAFRGYRFPAEVILWAVRWYLQFPISYRDLERMLADRGVEVDHTTMYRWVQRFAPELEKRTRRHLRPCRGPWHVDETYLRVGGEWRYLYRAVDKTGQTIDFLLTKERDEQAAKRFLIKAIRRHGVPEKITIDGSAANEAAIKSYNEEHGTTIEIRKIKYLNNIVEVRSVSLKSPSAKTVKDRERRAVALRQLHFRAGVIPAPQVSR